MSNQGNVRKSSCKRTITAKALAGSETWHATQTGSHSRPPKSPKNSKWKRWVVSDEDSNSCNESLHERQCTSKKKKNASSKHSLKEKSTAVEIEEVCDIENVMDSETEVINHESDAKSSEETENDNDEDAEGSDLGVQHKANIPAPLATKKQQANDLLTMFTQKCTVKFIGIEGVVDTKRGHWCIVCKDDEIFVKQNGKCKAFHLGSNSSCRQHICGHYEFYQAICKELGIAEHHYAIPQELVNLQSNGLKGKQMKIDGLFQKAEKKQESSRDIVANKTTFRDCLVAMHPASTTAELPLTHNITTYIHNAFIKLIESVKADIQSITTGRVATSTDLWSIDQTEASFLGLTAHWIEVKKNKWNLHSQVIAFCSVSGAHSGGSKMSNYR
ncbi:hypothetical protein BDR07DRAFT_1378634 [Suillus spraguei]|nr:hypothetical protein BDR07DRAFT_1378634 [Suillus spraguei]